MTPRRICLVAAALVAAAATLVWLRRVGRHTDIRPEDDQ